jgi:tetratricopeptide (TPR) repeat protein
MRTEGAPRPAASPDPLAGRRILVAITGSIAAVKMPLVVSALAKRGAKVILADIQTDRAAEAAKALSDQGLFLSPGTAFMNTMNEIVVNPLLQLGIRATDAGELAEASRLFEALVNLPRLPTSSDEPAKIFYNHARLLRKLGKPREAEGALRHALSTNAAYGSAYNELALLLADDGRLDEAVEPLTTALALPLPADRRARYACNLASIHAERGDLQAAERQLAVACAAAPSRADYARALESLRSNRSPEAISARATNSPAAMPQEAVP